MPRPTGPWAQRWDTAQTPGHPRLDEAYESGWTPEQGELEGPGPRGSTWLRFYRVPSARGPVTVDLLVGTDENGRVATYGLGCSAPLTSSLYDSLPQDALRKAAADALMTMQPWAPPMGDSTLKLRKVKKADRHGDEFLAQVASISRAALSRGQAVKAVADEADVSDRTAKRYIAEAKAKGHDVGSGD